MKKTIACALMFLLCLMSVMTVSARKNDIAFLGNSGLSVKEDAYIVGIPEKCQASAVTERLADSKDIYLKNGNGTICEESEIVGTGYKLSVIQHSVVNKTLEAVVKGDISGDGRVTSIDYLTIKKVFNGNAVLEGPYLEAADVNGDGRLLSADYLKIKMHFNGTQNLYTPLPAVSSAPAALPTANPNSMGDTVEYANQVVNQPQAYFRDESRSAFVVANANMELEQGILGEGTKNVRAFRNKDGGVYFTDTMDAFFQAPGKNAVYFKDSADPSDKIPAVCTRFGFYYYEAHIRHINFTGYKHLLDLTYNVLPESLHINYELEYKNAYTQGSVLGVETKIAKSTVQAMQVADQNGRHNDLSGLEEASVEYVAFDIKNAGVAGIIYPEDTQCTRVTVTSEGDYYVVRSIIEVPETAVDTKYNLNLQLYNDATHSFAGVEEAAHIERNPVQVTVVNTTNSKASYVGYDSATGTYRIKEVNNWYNFNTAYKNPNYYMYAGLKIQNDAQERPIYFWINSNVGSMECASLLDSNNKLLAVPMEVCKNFSGEMEDPVYDPTDAAYGDTFFPVYLKANETTQCTAVQYIQNWGRYALQQVSSVQFSNTAYYHQSTGASETTCFMPYGGSGKDGKFVGDFRGCSGDIWDSQPQFNHAGNFYAASENNNRMAFECTGAEILSAGPTYGSVKFSYIADNDNYKFTMTHTEFPQSDESRNYCTLTVEFLQDTVIGNVKNNFQLLTYHTVMGEYRNMAYLDKDGVHRTVKTSELTSVYPLNKDGSYYTLYTNSNKDTENVGIVIKDYAVTVNGGEIWDGNLAIRAYNATDWSLTLGAGKLSFKKGDRITVNLILLPYGNTQQTHCDNVLRVYKDSAVNPMTVQTVKGTVTEDPFMARINAVDNQAEFTLKGSRNLNTIRIDGFTGDAKPVLEEKLADGSWVLYDNSVETFDGYGVHYNADNTYGFSYVVDMGEDGAARTFRIAQ